MMGKIAVIVCGKEKMRCKLLISKNNSKIDSNQNPEQKLYTIHFLTLIYDVIPELILSLLTNTYKVNTPNVLKNQSVE